MGSIKSFFLLLLLHLYNQAVYCSFHINIKGNDVPVPPSMSDVATMVHNNTVYTYGGYKYNQPDGNDKIFSYTLDEQNGKMVLQLENEGHGPICYKCSAVLFPDSSEILVLAEPKYNQNSSLRKYQSKSRTVLPHYYNIYTRKWRVETLATTVDEENKTFYERFQHVTVSNDTYGVYILGGFCMSNISTPEPLFSAWYYNRRNNSYNVLPYPGNRSYLNSVGFLDR